MQLIAEAYHLMKDVIGLSHREMADTFSDWNRGVLDSFLIEITANILRYKVNCPGYLTEASAYPQLPTQPKMF